VPADSRAKTARQSARALRDKVPVDNSLFSQYYPKPVDKPVKTIGPDKKQIHNM